MNYEKYLKEVVNYSWVDIVRLSIQDNISVERMVKKLIEKGNLNDTDRELAKGLVKYIDEQLRLLIYNK